ncbi:GNAT family N-acetyltransferase [Mameliella alba]|nr:GNAT family N-acetyltransferase [Antarctobacter heliothermus]MBY6146193.1 GNAT family N-acetyltransferase [Mameliella alba]MCA0955378.1 GNAT family N-acetyltransferase [Mameliella alba]
MTMTIRPLPRAELDLTSGFVLPPDQAPFADLPLVSMQKGAARDGHLILHDDIPAGFFAIDRDYADTHDFAPQGVIGLRMFLVDQAHQGKGVAKAACRQLASYLPRHYDAMECWLTVNAKNPAARSAYLAGGFIDTLQFYHDGGYGPQHILRLPLER